MTTSCDGRCSCPSLRIDVSFDIVIPSEILLKSSDDVRRHDRHWCCVRQITIRDVYDEGEE